SGDKTSGVIKVWDLDSGKNILTLSGHNGPVTSLALSGDGERLFSGSEDTTIKVWDLVSGDTLTLRGHTDGVTSLGLSGDGKRLFSGSGGLGSTNEIKVWNLQSSKETLTLRGHSERVSSLALSANGKRLYSGSYDGTIKVWDLEAGKEPQTL